MNKSFIKDVAKKAQIKKVLIPKTVYRMENRQGLGPYHTNIYQKMWLYGKEAESKWKQNQAQFPGFKQDFPNATIDYKSGAFTSTGIEKWFGEFYEILDKEGFLLAEYVADDYIPGVSGTQVAFNSKTARLVQRKKLI